MKAPKVCKNLQKLLQTCESLQKLLQTFSIVAANHVGEMHEMHIYYLFIAWTDHRSNDFQVERTSLMTSHS